MVKMLPKREIGVLFVCLGNICRSPTAEGAFRQCVERAGLDLIVHIDSAGTADYHVGQPPDARAIAAAAKRGIRLKNLRARQIESADFERFDYIIAMDDFNYEDLLALAPTGHSCEISLFMKFAETWPEQTIPDPYYGGQHGFERVLDMIDAAAAGLIADIRKKFLES